MSSASNYYPFPSRRCPRQLSLKAPAVNVLGNEAHEVWVKELKTEQGKYLTGSEATSGKLLPHAESLGA